MDIEEDYEHIKKNKKLRIHVTTNRNLQFITAIRPEATISQLANRALNVYLELSGESYLQNASKKQLTVSAVKQGVFYMPKSENVSNLLNQDDQVEVVIIKAKPKYPNQFCQPKSQQTKIESINKKNEKYKEISEQVEKDLNIFQLEGPVEKEEPLLLEQQDIKRPNMHGNEEKVIKESVITSSKRQKKKQKKREKFDLKRKIQQGYDQKIKNQTKRREISPQLKDLKQRQFMLQNLPKKKVKFDKEQNQNSSQKVIKQIIAPSPKITFHPDPKIDSPRLLLLQSQKKKFNFQGAQNKNVDVQNRKLSEDVQKKNNFQKILSPLFSNKSPFLNQKNIQSHSSLQNVKEKEKQQFSNFSLMRKGSEDKRVQVKKDKNKEDTSSIRSKNQSVRQIKETNFLKGSAEKSTEKIVENSHIEANQAVKSSQKISLLKPTKSLVILQPPSDSQSEQKKDIHDCPFQSHRYRQLAEIKNKISSFLIQSDEQE